MLTEVEINAIDHEIAKFPAPRHACLDALMIVQKYRGYVSDDALAQVAEYLGMSATELDGIATFYNLIYRKPVGRNVIRLCDSVSCHIMGYENIRKKIIEELGIDFGQTTKDGRYTLLPAQCLGLCEQAPAMMINDNVHSKLKAENLSTILSPVTEASCAP